MTQKVVAAPVAFFGVPVRLFAVDLVPHDRHHEAVHGPLLVEEHGCHLAQVARVHVLELRRVVGLLVAQRQVRQAGRDRVRAHANANFVGAEPRRRGLLPRAVRVSLAMRNQEVGGGTTRMNCEFETIVSPKTEKPLTLGTAT